MTLSLSPEEARTLQEILESYLSELRMEIADTENMDLREELKEGEDFLNRLIEQLTAE